MTFRVATFISTGALIEGQSGSGDLEILRTNAAAAGINLADVDVREVTDAEFQVLLDATVPPPPTTDEIYDAVIQNQKVLKAIVLSLNDGTLVPGANVSNATLKAIVKANM